LLGPSKFEFSMCIQMNTKVFPSHDETGEMLLYFNHAHDETWEILMYVSMHMVRQKIYSTGVDSIHTW
jgi:hypothetical protein